MSKLVKADQVQFLEIALPLSAFRIFASLPESSAIERHCGRGKQSLLLCNSFDSIVRIVLLAPIECCVCVGPHHNISPASLDLSFPKIFSKGQSLEIPGILVCICQQALHLGPLDSVSSRVHVGMFLVLGVCPGYITSICMVVLLLGRQGCVSLPAFLCRKRTVVYYRLVMKHCQS
jgi:hypothetical protein